MIDRLVVYLLRALRGLPDRVGTYILLGACSCIFGAPKVRDNLLFLLLEGLIELCVLRTSDIWKLPAVPLLFGLSLMFLLLRASLCVVTLEDWGWARFY